MSSPGLAERALEEKGAICHSSAGPPPSREPDDEVSRLRAEVQRLRGEQDKFAERVGELTRALEAREAFLSRAAYELRNPMGGILLGVSGLLHTASSKSDVPAWVIPRLEALDRQARGFVRRAGVLLDVLRVGSGDLRLEKQRISLGDLVGGVVHDLAAEIHEARCEVRLQTEPGVFGWWDRSALEEVTLHFLSNAIKYGAGRPIEIEVGQADGIARLQVRDHGMGISQADRDRIFAAFEDSALRVPNAGFGLGLWIARHIVRAHGGEIAVESAPGAGSIFTARLPQAIHMPQP